MVWDEGTIRHLRELWTQGLSTAEIGRRLGVTKNAIVGKAHRLDLDARPSPIRREAKPADGSAGQSRAAGPTLPPLPSAFSGGALSAASQPAGIQRVVTAPRPAAAATPTPVPAAQTLRIVPVAPRTVAVTPPARRSAPACCWPIGEPGTKAFRFCDDASMAGRPYCEEHAKLAYVRVKDRKEDAA